jgi:hypothetical protein
VLCFEVLAEGCEGGIMRLQSGITWTSKDVVGVLPELAAFEASAVCHVIKGL